jgi:hypothetical protein
MEKIGLPGPNRVINTETGEIYEPRWITHKDLNPDTNEYDAGLFDTGIPRQFDDLITDKMYRRKIQAIIRRGRLRYLLAAADIARGGENPAAYFATMTAKKNWPGTKAAIIRTRAHLRYAELDEDYEVSPGSPYYRRSFTTLATEWIIAALTANGPMRSSDFLAKAKADGMYRSEGTFSGARKLAGVQTGRAGGAGWWVWLPGQDRPVDHPDGPDGRYGGGELAAEGLTSSGDRPTPSNSQCESNSQGIEGLSIGVGIPGGDRPTPDPNREHYPRFARSCILSSTQAEFNAVPEAKRRQKDQRPRPVTPRELDELLDAFDPASDDPGDCVLWTGATDKDEYAIFKAGGKQYRAHRWLWMLHHGPIAAGLEMAHHASCPRHCVIHVTPETKKKNLAERRKPRSRRQAQADAQAHRDETRAARFRREQAEYWSKPQAQREAEYRAAMAKESGCG